MPNISIVTGASRGIGREVSIALAEGDHQVIVLARSEQHLKQLESQFPKNIQAYTIDLTSKKEIEQFIPFFRDKYGQADILVNNAGSLINESFENLSMDDWYELLDANLISNVLLTKSLLPYFSTQAHIVNISSMGGYQGSSKFPGLAAYSVAKGAVGILSECLAVELSGRNIKVNALCLGAVQTEMLSRAFPGFEAPVTAKQMGRYIADFALKGSSLYNGQILPVTLGDPG